MTTAHPLDPHLTALRTDLSSIAVDLRWAYADAWWPTRIDPTAPRQHPLPEVRAAVDPDHVPGRKYDLGVGDDTTRATLAIVTDHLRSIELRTAAALHLTGRHPEQPALHRPSPYSSLEQLDGTIRNIRWRLTAIDDDTAHLTKLERSAIRHQLRHSAGRADQAVRHLAKALGRGDTGGVAHAEPKCRICGIRPQAQRDHQVRQPNGSRRTVKRASQGGRCDTCATYFRRNGNERSRDLDKATVEDALAAARRRRARGEDHADSPLPRATA